MPITKWRCEECGATGEVSHGAHENTFEVAGKVIANHNATVAGCQRRPDSLVGVGGDPVLIMKEPAKRGWVV